MRLGHLAPFDWKFLYLGILRDKDLRKNELVFQEGGSTPASPSPPPENRVVSLNMILYKFLLSLRLGHLAPFDWKFLQIGTLRAKDLRKNVPV